MINYKTKETERVSKRGAPSMHWHSVMQERQKMNTCRERRETKDGRMQKRRETKQTKFSLPNRQQTIVKAITITQYATYAAVLHNMHAKS